MFFHVLQDPRRTGMQTPPFLECTLTMASPHPTGLGLFIMDHVFRNAQARARYQFLWSHKPLHTMKETKDFLTIPQPHIPLEQEVGWSCTCLQLSELTVWVKCYHPSSRCHRSSKGPHCSNSHSAREEGSVSLLLYSLRHCENDIISSWCYLLDFLLIYIFLYGWVCH